MSEISEIQSNGQTHSDKIIPKPKISLAITVKYALYSYINAVFLRDNQRLLPGCFSECLGHLIRGSLEKELGACRSRSCWNSVSASTSSVLALSPNVMQST